MVFSTQLCCMILHTLVYLAVPSHKLSSRLLEGRDKVFSLCYLQHLFISKEYVLHNVLMNKLVYIWMDERESKNKQMNKPKLHNY